MTRHRLIANRPVSLRSVAWLVAAGLLAVAVLRASPGVHPEVLVAAGAAIMCALALGPARELFTDGRDDQLPETDDIERRLDDLEAREAGTIAIEQRMAELENRLDFAERLLAQRDEPAQLPEHRTPV